MNRKSYDDAYKKLKHLSILLSDFDDYIYRL